MLTILDPGDLFSVDVADILIIVRRFRAAEPRVPYRRIGMDQVMMILPAVRALLL